MLCILLNAVPPSAIPSLKLRLLSAMPYPLDAITHSTLFSYNSISLYCTTLLPCARRHPHATYHQLSLLPAQNSASSFPVNIHAQRYVKNLSLNGVRFPGSQTQMDTGVFEPQKTLRHRRTGLTEERGQHAEAKI